MTSPNVEKIGALNLHFAEVHARVASNWRQRLVYVTQNHLQSIPDKKLVHFYYKFV